MDKPVNEKGIAMIMLRIALISAVLGIAYKMLTGDTNLWAKLGYIARTIVGDTPPAFFEQRTWRNEDGQISVASIKARLSVERTELVRPLANALLITA
jgi:hypothetical protein